ncbi:uncharacterized protein [Nicotiana sylvestris]|uniref:uncharacterized protein n=1 Tax=Nicotiana sylvestris TaxID=4096 RepID=UPI00388CDD85
MVQGESVLVIANQNEHDDGGEKEEESVDGHEEHIALDIANKKEKSKNEEESGDEKDTDTDDKIGEQVNNSVEEEKHSEEEDKSESEDQEKVSGSEGVDEKSEGESDNLIEEFEGSMTIGNTIIAPSEETSEEKRIQEPGPLLTSFTGDEEVSSDEDDLPLSKVGKKPMKTPMKATKSSVPTRK